MRPSNQHESGRLFYISKRFAKKNLKKKEINHIFIQHTHARATSSSGRTAREDDIKVFCTDISLVEVLVVSKIVCRKTIRPTISDRSLSYNNTSKI